MPTFYWSDENEKMVKTSKKWTKRFGEKARFVSFNLPQLSSKDGQKMCPYAGACADVCYADQGRMAMAKAKNTRERNLAVVNKLNGPGLVDALVSDLRRKRSTTHVRIHDSGDFFSRAYYRNWIKVAQEVPEIIFYAYTKSIPFLDWDAHPDNFRIVQSLGGKMDLDIDRGYPHARIFANHADRERAKYCDGNESDIPAVIGELRIGLVYHGVRNLTEKDLIQLRVV